MKDKCRRILAVLLLGAVFLSLAACGGGSESDPGGTTSSGVESGSSSSSSSSGIQDDRTTKEKLADAKKANSDVVAWLSLPGAGIDEPVVQTTNNDYYERRGLDKKYSYLGTLWIDYECTMAASSKDFSRNTVIYGHNVDDDRVNGKMFAQLINYDNVEFAKNNKFITMTTENEELTWVVFAAFYTDIGFYYIHTDPKDTVFKNLISEAKARSEINSGISVDITDKILTLSTCTYKYGDNNLDQRFVVMARLLRSGETKADFPDPTDNPNPKAPSF